MTTDDLRFRRPIEADHPVVSAVVDEWWGGRKMRAILPRLWFRHFAGTSWIAERRRRAGSWGSSSGS